MLVYKQPLVLSIMTSLKAEGTNQMKLVTLLRSGWKQLFLRSPSVQRDLVKVLDQLKHCQRHW